MSIRVALCTRMFGLRLFLGSELTYLSLACSFSLKARVPVPKEKEEKGKV